MLDQSLRFGAVLSQPEFNNGGTLLEVGSGPRGITAFVEDSVVGVDVHFSEKLSTGMTAIKASSTALPLQDESFDRVVCSDMLEHLSANERELAISELLRVTRKTLFLTCPCGEGSRRVDGWLAKLYQTLGIPMPDWLKEHLEKKVPDPEEIRDVLEEQKTTFSEHVRETTFIYLLVGLMSSSRILNKFWQSIFSGRPDRAKKLAKLNLFSEMAPCRRLWVVNK